MGRKIEVEIDNIVFTAELLEDKAPTICKAIWDALPLDSEEETSMFGAVHSSWSGNTVNMAWLEEKIPSFHDDENATIYGAAGDLVLYLTTVTARELFICYGLSQFRYVSGNLRGNLFAKITEDLDKLAEVCRNFKVEGKKRVILRKK